MLPAGELGGVLGAAVEEGPGLGLLAARGPAFEKSAENVRVSLSGTRSP